MHLRLDERGIPFCVSDTGEVQCPCKENFAGEFCDQCAPGYYNFPECKRKLLSPKIIMNFWSFLNVKID